MPSRSVRPLLYLVAIGAIAFALWRLSLPSGPPAAPDAPAPQRPAAADTSAVAPTSTPAHAGAPSPAASSGPKLYWLILDGLRAEPEVFDVYRWAAEGKLPNLARLMAAGASGYSLPVFPSHTPVNYATLLTGTLPRTHGVSDGPMHAEGHPLATVSVGGFRSVARRIPAVWSHLEATGRRVVVLSIPGSTPFELEDGVVIRGRWGGLGGEVHAVNFESAAAGRQPPRDSRLFFAGAPLTQPVEPRPATDWAAAPPSHDGRPPLEAPLAAWGVTAHAYVYDGTPDGTPAYDHVAFAADRAAPPLAQLAPGEWSAWADLDLPVAGRAVRSAWRFHVIALAPDGTFRLRILYDNLNELVTQPPEAAAALRAGVGPMVDFVDNFPPQLVHAPEDRRTFLAELDQSFDWHTRAVPFLWREFAPDTVIHGQYSPNQMLTSRWWLGAIDPASARWVTTDEGARATAWAEVEGMYRQVDALIGAALDAAGPDALVVLSADHGACALNRWVHLNNLFAQKGLLSVTTDPQTGAPAVDWAHSRAVYLKMIGVYVHPNGLAGDWTRGSGPEYDRLRAEVAAILRDLTDADGRRPVASVTPWEEVESTLGLAADRVGDLVIANALGYGWNEELTEERQVFSTPLVAGYKQAIPVEGAHCLWTPFVVDGPGVKKGYRLAEPVRHVDQLPTLLKLMGVAPPAALDGRALDELMEAPPAPSSGNVEP